MKDLGIIIVLFGVKYQKFLPIYLLSLNKTYGNDYDVYVYTDREINKEIIWTINNLSIKVNYYIKDIKNHINNFAEKTKKSNPKII